jgi:hypothetical protein
MKPRNAREWSKWWNSLTGDQRLQEITAATERKRKGRAARTLAPMLIANTVASTEPCRWCGADGRPHSQACPLGERYKQVQQLGGVPMAPLHGEALLDFFRGERR